MESLWQWHDALGAKEDMPQCSDDSDSEILFSKFDNRAFLAKFVRRLKRARSAGGRFSLGMIEHVLLGLLF
ncbi:MULTISPECIES: hypothetical protein [Paraburkholderia]|uniref:hypothetical protein n=1 Tax=Paraburkholderia TaxID=1822464 RepID=UPI00224D55B9|nr:MULTISPECIES: hypothetical protein [Paraburkholderia]MCX4171161.1 hypothetical protein [Paraburkholderia madseniana]MDQ6459173.1 hypothetical protein [Paraburkholderia madseniana]